MPADAPLHPLEQLLRERIVILDGAMGTTIQQYKLDEAAYRGERFADHPSDLKGNNDLLCLTRPQVVEEVHIAYLQAGADLIETNTFNATTLSQAAYGLEALAYELNVTAAGVARRAADKVQGAFMVRRLLPTAGEVAADAADALAVAITHAHLRAARLRGAA